MLSSETVRYAPVIFASQTSPPGSQWTPGRHVEMDCYPFFLSASRSSSSCRSRAQTREPFCPFHCLFLGYQQSICKSLTTHAAFTPSILLPKGWSFLLPRSSRHPRRLCCGQRFSKRTRGALSTHLATSPLTPPYLFLALDGTRHDAYIPDTQCFGYGLK